MSDDSTSGQPPAEKRSNARHKWADLIEERLNEARDRGDFEHLEGKGKPLALDSNPYAGDRALAYSLLKNNNIAPPEIERGKEIDNEIKRAEELLATLRRRQQALRPLAGQRDARQAYNITRDATALRYETMLREINSKILSLNIVAPAALHRKRLDVETMMREFQIEFPRMEE